MNGDSQASLTKENRVAKPRVSVADVAILARIDEYVRHYDCRGARLVEAASDVLDGLVTRREVESLVRRRLLGIEHIRRTERYFGADESEICGISWTVYLTDRACKTLWSTRK